MLKELSCSEVNITSMSSKDPKGKPLETWSQEDIVRWFNDQGYPVEGKVDISSLNGAKLSELVRAKVCEITFTLNYGTVSDIF